MSQFPIDEWRAWCSNSHLTGLMFPSTHQRMLRFFSSLTTILSSMARNLAVACRSAAPAPCGSTVNRLGLVRRLREGGKPNKLQQAFIDEQAAQCGYCISGMIMVAQALLDRNPNPAESEVRSALNGNLCRCGTHTRIVRAVLRAAKEV
jgi:hypothetical protein